MALEVRVDHGQRDTNLHERHKGEDHLGLVVHHQCHHVTALQAAVDRPVRNCNQRDQLTDYTTCVQRRTLIGEFIDLCVGVALRGVVVVDVTNSFAIGRTADVTVR